MATIGLGWDDRSRRVITSNEGIWYRLIKENPGWAKYRRNRLAQYPDLCIIFGDSYVSGSYACSNIQDLLNDDDDIGIYGKLQLNLPHQISKKFMMLMKSHVRKEMLTTWIVHLCY